MPLIKALEMTTGAAHDKLRIAIQTGNVVDTAEIIALVKSSGALDYCRDKALKETQLARRRYLPYPVSIYRQGLLDLMTMASPTFCIDD